MITVQIDTDDKGKVQEFLELAAKKFQLKAKVTPLETSHQTKKSQIISSDLDTQIRNAKPVNTTRTQKLKDAVEDFQELIDPAKRNMSLSQAREEYFKTKAD